VKDPISKLVGRKALLGLLALVLSGLLLGTGGIASATGFDPSDATVFEMQTDVGGTVDPPLSPAFDSSIDHYTITVGRDAQWYSVRPLPNNGLATVTVNGANNPYGYYANVALHDGDNPITIVVTSQNGTATRTYTIDVTRTGSSAPAASSDATLSTLTVSKGSLSPAFDPAGDLYDVELPVDTHSIDITPTTNDPDATFTVTYDGDGAPVAIDADGGTATVPLRLNRQRVSIDVTAADGTTMQYAINVHVQPSADTTLASLTVSRGTLSPVFDPATADYTMDVANDVTSLDLTAFAGHANQELQIDKPWAGLHWFPAFGTPQTVPLDLGANKLQVYVLAENQSSFQYYNLTVNRAWSSDAHLPGLSLAEGALAPAFDPATTAYALTVAHSVAQAHFSVSYGSLSGVDFGGSNWGDENGHASVELHDGENVITVTAHAQDSTTTKTYTVTITRENAPTATPTPTTPPTPTLTVVPATLHGSTAPVRAREFSTSRKVKLEIHGTPTNATKVVISNAHDFTDAQSFPVAADGVYSWTLSEDGDGVVRTVYVKFVTAGGKTATASATVKLDDRAPVLGKAKVVRQKHGRTTVKVPASDAGSGLAYVQFAPNKGRLWAWRAYLKRVSVRTKKHFIWVRTADAAGNVSAWTKIRFPKAD
jgi:hypothetical protein